MVSKDIDKMDEVIIDLENIKDIERDITDTDKDIPQESEDELANSKNSGHSGNSGNSNTATMTSSKRRVFFTTQTRKNKILFMILLFIFLAVCAILAGLGLSRKLYNEEQISNTPDDKRVTTAGDASDDKGGLISDKGGSKIVNVHSVRLYD